MLYLPCITDYVNNGFCCIHYSAVWNTQLISYWLLVYISLFLSGLLQFF